MLWSAHGDESIYSAGSGTGASSTLITSHKISCSCMISPRYPSGSSEINWRASTRFIYGYPFTQGSDMLHTMMVHGKKQPYNGLRRYTFQAVTVDMRTHAIGSYIESLHSS